MAYKYSKPEIVYLKGKAKWAHRLFQPDLEFNKWSTVLYPDKESLEKIRDLQAEGVKNVLKKDDDGYYTTFSRPTQKLMKGKVVAFTPPVVTDKDGQPFTDPIGNGSDITIKLEVYQHGTPGGGKAKAARLMAVRVDNHVPFEQERDFTDEQMGLVSGLNEQPAPQF